MTKIKVKQVTRSTFIHLDDMRNKDGSVHPHFNEVFLNMLRNRVSMDLEIHTSEYQAQIEGNSIGFGNDMVEFCDQHCTGFWSRMDKEPEEITPVRRVVDAMTERVFRVTLITLFEKSSDADHFMSHFALVKKLESD